MTPPDEPQIERRIAHDYFCRFHMSVILAAVIASGVLASKCLLELGVSLRFRYPIAVLPPTGCSCCWCASGSGTCGARRGQDRDPAVLVCGGSGGSSGGSFSFGGGSGGSGSSRGFSGFGGGDSGGGGASSSWEGNEAAAMVSQPSSGVRIVGRPLVVRQVRRRWWRRR